MKVTSCLKVTCAVVLLTASASVTALDLGGVFGKKKEEAKKTEQTETLKTIKPKLAEQETKINNLKAEYSKKDPEAGNLMTKFKGYGSQLSDMNTKYGNVSGKLDTYLCGKYPKYKKTSDTCSALKKNYDSLKGTPSSDKPKEKKSGWGSVLGGAAKSSLKDAGSGSAEKVKEELKKEQAKLATMKEDLSKETPEGKKLSAECSELQSKMATLSKDQESTDLELTTLLKKRYPDFKSVTDDYDVLKKKYDALKAEKKN